MFLCERKIRETWNCIIAAHCCSLSKQEAFSHSHCLKLNYSPLITCCTFGHCPSDREQELHLLRAALPSQGSCSCTSTLPAGPHTQFVSLATSFLIPVLNLTHRFIFPKSLKELKKKNRKKRNYTYAVQTWMCWVLPPAVHCIIIAAGSGLFSFVLVRWSVLSLPRPEKVSHLFLLAKLFAVLQEGEGFNQTL